MTERHLITSTDGNGHEHSQSVLARISSEVVRTLKASFGKGPVKAKSYLVDDFLLVVMREGMTVAEQTMLERGHGDLVRGFRQTFQNEMADALIAKVEALTGRTVVNYQSQVLFDPDIMLEIFFFEPSDDGAAEPAAEVESER